MIFPNQPQQFNKQKREKGINPMKRTIERITRAAMLAVAFMLCATSAWAAVPKPVAVWYGDFNKEIPGYTLITNDNVNCGSYIDITSTTGKGIDINFTSPMNNTGLTVIFKYSNFSYSSSYAKMIFTTCVENSYTYDRTGVDLQKQNTLRGVWLNDSHSWNDNGDNAGTVDSAGYMAFTYKGGAGTYLYHSEQATSYSQKWGASGLHSGNDTNIYGATIGGMRYRNNNWIAAQGMRITGIAIFSGVLSTSDMANYSFPETVSSDTTASALNEAYAGQNTLNLVVADGVTIELDEPFSATTVILANKASTDVLKLTASSQPSAEELAKFDFTDILGCVTRSWLNLGVVGFNFNAGQGSATSTALAAGTWASDSLSGNSSSTALFSDGLSKLTWTSRGYHEFGGKTTFMHGYLDDNSSTQPTIKLSGVPYETYDVIIYCATDSGTSFSFSAKQVNGTYYTWNGSATVPTEDQTAHWGVGGDNSAAYGTNAIRINGLHGALSINGGLYKNDSQGHYRGCIAAIQITPTELVIDATEGLEISDSDLKLNIRSGYSNVRIMGSGNNGVTVDMGNFTAADMYISSHIVFDGGHHVFKMSAGALDSTADKCVISTNTKKPFLEVESGTTLDFYQHDLTGWLGTAENRVPKTNVKVNDGGVLNIYPNGSGTTYYQGRYTIEPGGTVKSCFADGASPSNFRLNGGAVQDYEQIYVPASDPGSTHAVLSGCESNTGLHLHTDSTQGLGIFVGENSTLDVDLNITSSNANQPIGKWGDGTLNLNGNMSGYGGTLTVHEGMVYVSTATTLASVATESGATLAYSYSAKPTISSYSGDGMVSVDVSSLVEGGVIPSGTYELLPSGLNVRAQRVTITGLPDGSSFRVVASEVGVALTDQEVFVPEWTGASSAWTSSVFDGRTGYQENKSLKFWHDDDPETAVTVTVDGAKNAASMSFLSDETAYTFTGDAVSTTGNLAISGTAPVVFQNALTVGGSLSLGTGTSLTVSSPSLSLQNGGLTGAGTLNLDPGEGNTNTMSQSNSAYTGEAVIKSGTVKMSEKEAFGRLGRSNSIRVKGGAALSIGCNNGATEGETNRLILEENATYTSYASVADIKLFPISHLELAGNANVVADIANVGITKHYNDALTIAMNGYTLTKTGTNTMCIAAATLTGEGVLSIEEGTLNINSGYYSEARDETTFANGTLNIASGATVHLDKYRRDATLSVKNLILNGVVTRKTNDGTAASTLTVTGELSGTGTTPILTLADGATLKPKSSTGGLTVTESLTLSGTINVDLSDVDLTGKYDLPIITGPTQIDKNSVSFNRGSNSSNWGLYSELVSEGTYVLGVRLSTITDPVSWDGEGGTWSVNSFNGETENYSNQASQTVTFADDAGSSATPLAVTVSGAKTVNALNFTADNRNITLSGDAITADTVSKSGDGVATINSDLSVATSISVADGVFVLNPTDAVVADEWTESDNGTLVVYVGAGETTTLPEITATTLIKRGAGELLIDATSNISGDIVVETGTLISKASTIWSIGNSVTVNTGATLNVNGEMRINKNPGKVVTTVMTLESGATCLVRGNLYAYDSEYVSFAINGAITVDGNFYSKGDISVGTKGAITVGSSGSLAALWHIENNGTITLPALANLKKYADGQAQTKITNSSTGKVVFNLAANMDVRSTDLTAYFAGSGKIVLNGNVWCGFSREGQWSSTIAVENNLKTTSGGFVFPRTSTIGTLSGDGLIRTDLDTGASDPADRVITVVQTTNSVWSGTLYKVNGKMGTFAVSAAKGATEKTLTLSGTQQSGNDYTGNGKPLVVNASTETTDAGSVNLTGTWIGDATVYGELGGTGSLTGDLTFNAGSTFKVWETGGLSVTGSLTLPNSGKVDVDVRAISLSEDGTTIMTLGSTPASISALSCDHAVLELDGTSIKAYPAVASVTDGNGFSTSYATLQAAENAVLALIAGGSTYKYITILADVSFTPTQNNRYKIADGVEITLLPLSAEWSVPVASDPDPNYNGAVTYNLRAARNQTTYTWSGAATYKYWALVGNWTYGESLSATRVPNSGDSIIVNSDTTGDGNAITIAADTEVKDISIGNTVKMTAPSAKTLTVTDGVVLTSASATLEISGSLSLESDVTTSVADKCVKWVYDGSSITYSVADPVAQIGDVRYGLLANAFEAAVNNDTITLLADCSEAIELDGKSITFREEDSTFSGSFTGTGTLTLTTWLKSANVARWAADWEGTVVIPAFTVDQVIELNKYGILGSTVRVMGGIVGWLSTDVVNPTIELGADWSLPYFSPSFNNTLTKLKGTHKLTLASTSAVDLSQNAYSPYFLIKDVSEFTGSLETHTAGMVLGRNDKPSDINDGGKILVYGTDAKVFSGKTWAADSGVVVNGTLTVEGTLSGATSVSDDAKLVVDGASATVSGALTLAGGSTLSFADEDSVLAATSVVLPESGTVSLNFATGYAFPEIGNPAITLLTTGTTGLNLNKFAFAEAIAGQYCLAQDGSGNVTLSHAKARIGTTPYAAVADALGVFSVSIDHNIILQVFDDTYVGQTTWVSTYGIVWDESSRSYSYAEAAIGATKYATISDAFESATAGSVVNLNKNVTANPVLPAGVVLNLNGHTLTGTVTTVEGYVVGQTIVDDKTVYTSHVNTTGASWTDGSGDHAWNNYANWSLGFVPVASTPVTFPEGTHMVGLTANNGDNKCASLILNGNVTLQRGISNWVVLYLHGAGGVSGSGTLTLNQACLHNSYGSTLEIACPMVVNGSNDSAMLGSAWEISGDVTVNGYFKCQVAVTVTGNASFADGSKVQTQKTMTFSGTTTLNGTVYRNTDYNYESLVFGNVIVAESSSINGSGPTTFSGTVSLNSGTSLTVPTETTSVSGTVQRAAGVAGYSVKVTESGDNTIYSLEKRGTIFSVY